MTICKNCGKELREEATICPNCGTPVEKDKGGFGWGLLGCCLPFIGIILFFVWRKKKPRTAKAIIIGVAIGLLLMYAGQMAERLAQHGMLY